MLPGGGRELPLISGLRLLLALPAEVRRARCLPLVVPLQCCMMWCVLLARARALQHPAKNSVWQHVSQAAGSSCMRLQLVEYCKLGLL